MLTDTDCAVRFATHARQIDRVNELEWMRPVVAGSPYARMRRWLATTLISLASRVAPSPAVEPPLPGLADVSGGSRRVGVTLRG